MGRGQSGRISLGPPPLYIQGLRAFFTPQAVSGKTKCHSLLNSPPFQCLRGKKVRFLKKNNVWPGQQRFKNQGGGVGGKKRGAGGAFVWGKDTRAFSLKTTRIWGAPGRRIVYLRGTKESLGAAWPGDLVRDPTVIRTSVLAPTRLSDKRMGGLPKVFPI